MGASIRSDRRALPPAPFSAAPSCCPCSPPVAAARRRDASTTTLLKDTFSGGKAVKSGKLDVSLGFQAQGLPTLTGPIAFKLAGPFASEGAGKLPKFDFDLDIAAGGQTINAGAVSLGDTGFLKFGGHAYSVDKALFDQFKTGYEKSQQSAKARTQGRRSRRWASAPRPG